MLLSDAEGGASISAAPPFPRHPPSVLYIAIPAHNEVETIGVLLWRLRSVLAEFPREYEVIVYDDASSDGTAEVLESYRKVLPLTVLRSDRQVGYATATDALLRHSALQTRHPRRDAVMLLQGDFTDPPGLIPEFARRFEGGADLVIGERTALADAPSTVNRLFRFAGWSMRPFVRVDGIRDVTSSLRLVRIAVVRDLIQERGDAPLCEGDSWTANADLLLRLVPFTRRIETIPLQSTYGVRMRETRRIATRDGIAAFKWAWSARHRRVSAIVGTDLVDTPRPRDEARLTLSRTGDDTGQGRTRTRDKRDRSRKDSVRREPGARNPRGTVVSPAAGLSTESGPQSLLDEAAGAERLERRRKRKKRTKRQTPGSATVGDTLSLVDPAAGIARTAEPDAPVDDAELASEGENGTPPHGPEAGDVRRKRRRRRKRARGGSDAALSGEVSDEIGRTGSGESEADAIADADEVTQRFIYAESKVDDSSDTGSTTDDDQADRVENGSGEHAEGSSEIERARSRRRGRRGRRGGRRSKKGLADGATSSEPSGERDERDSHNENLPDVGDDPYKPDNRNAE